MASIAYPSGITINYARDAMGRVTSVAAQPSGPAAAVSVLSGISYQPFGPQNALTFGNGIAETRTFDLDYRLTALTAAGMSPVRKSHLWL